MTISGYLLPSGEGKSVGAIGVGITMKTNGDSTAGAYSLFEYAVPAGVKGPPPHVHTREDESFVCLAGGLRVMVGGVTYDLHHGDYLLLPRNVVHTFENPFGEDARVISVVSPAGLERYYEALSSMPPGPRDIGKMKEIMAEFGIELQLPQPPTALPPTA